ncbi:hypothetical protein LY76DRAFT_648787 [Colletotrichum caudatum]|nr:hypothetical protein LY76DRAFT_648787 [Colletotrichum caudatum]
MPPSAKSLPEKGRPAPPSSHVSRTFVWGAFSGSHSVSNTAGSALFRASRDPTRSSMKQLLAAPSVAQARTSHSDSATCGVDDGAQPGLPRRWPRARRRPRTRCMRKRARTAVRR